MTYDYLLCGWRVRSFMVLPELLSWQGGNIPPDVEILLGAIPLPVSPLVFALPHHHVYGDGSYVLNMPSIARYWVKDGRHIIIDPLPSSSEHDVRIFLLSSVLGILCHQRHLFPLQAAVVEMDGKAIILAGPTSVGKSTLAAAMVQRGHRLVADEVAVIDPTPTTGPLVLATFPVVKLGLDVMAMLQLDATDLPVNRPGQPKVLVSMKDTNHLPALPLSNIYRLVRTGVNRSKQLKTLSLLESIVALDSLVFRREIGKHIVAKDCFFNISSKLAQKKRVIDIAYYFKDSSCPPSFLAETLENHLFTEINQ